MKQAKPKPEILTASQYRQLRKDAEKQNKATNKKRHTDSAHTKKLKKADAEHSLWFRASEANEQGAVQCVTCGRWMMWKSSDGSTHCGHYESRGFAAARFMPENCGVQCRTCNYYLEGAKIKMREYLVNRHGEEKVLEIERLAKMPNKRLSDFELDEIIKARKSAREKLVKAKGL